MTVSSILHRLRMSYLIAALFPLLLASGGLATAQEAEGPLLVQVRTTEINPGMNGKFEEFLTRLNALNREHETGTPTFVTRGRTGHNAYYSITLYDKFSDLKPGAGWRKTFGEQETQRLSELLAESVEGGHVQTFWSRRELSRMPDGGAADSDAFVTLLVKIKAGSGPSYQEALGKLVEASAKVAPDVRWIAYSPGMHSDRTWRFVIPQNWETADQPGMSIAERFTRAFGEEEGMKWLQQLNGAVESAETIMTIARPDLSSLPDA